MKKDYLERQSYSTDLTDKQCSEIESLFADMREYKYSKRELLNAVLYLVDNGCKWRNLPHDFPAWQTVYSFFRRAIKSRLWDRILERMIELTRKKEERNPHPSYAFIDSQSVKTIYASEKTGFDGGKRHIVIDSIGCILAVKVHRANFHDTKAGIFVAIRAFRLYPTIKKFCGDGSYLGNFVTAVKKYLGVRRSCSCRISRYPETLEGRENFGNSRKLAIDFEIKSISAETLIKFSHSYTLLKRL